MTIKDKADFFREIAENLEKFNTYEKDPLFSLKMKNL